MLSKKENRIAGLIIAAGESSRLNSPKQLLKWRGNYLINHIVNIAAKSAIHEIVVVLGSRFEKIKSIIHDKNVTILENKDWQYGMSSSIKAGISSLSNEITGAFIILVDQPFITTNLFNTMTMRFNQTSANIIAPIVGRQQANPVLFRKQFFPKLLEISGDRGAKALLKENSVEWVEWQDSKLLLDIDSEDDYLAALKMTNS